MEWFIWLLSCDDANDNNNYLTWLDLTWIEQDKNKSQNTEIEEK